MSGFDNGTQQGGVFAQTKQFGSVLRGFGPPVPEAGVTGDLYIDVQTWQLFARRAAGLNPWGHFLFVVPATYQARLKWFAASMPTNDIGADGDYALVWGGFPNYGMQPSIVGPKAAGAWPPNPAAVAVTLNILYTAADVTDLSGPGAVPVIITTPTYLITTPGAYYVNRAGAVDITLAPSLSMGYLDTVIKDISGNASTNNISVHADAGDAGGVDALNPYVINSDFGAVRLAPLTLGYAVVP